MIDRGPNITKVNLSMTINKATRRTRRTWRAEKQGDAPTVEPPPQSQTRGTASQLPWLQLQAYIDELR